MEKMRWAAHLIALALYAQDSSAVYKPVLWRVSSNWNVLYLLGSMHVGSRNMYPLPNAIEDAFERCTVLVTETGEDTAGIGGERGLYPRGDSLWKHVSDETRRRLTEVCKKGHLSARNCSRMRPWAAALSVEMIDLQGKGFDGDLGIDRHFLDEAKKDAKKISGAESSLEQMKLLADMPEELQFKWLESNLGEPVEGIEAVERHLTGERNMHMADAAEKFMKGVDTAFMVVGSGHVDGDDGIVRILERRGYRVEMVVGK